jgi:hypothetical protein
MVTYTESTWKKNPNKIWLTSVVSHQLILGKPLDFQTWHPSRIQLLMIVVCCKKGSHHLLAS